MKSLQRVDIQMFVPSDKPFVQIASALTRLSEDLDGYWAWNARPAEGARGGCFEIRTHERRPAAPVAPETASCSS